MRPPVRFSALALPLWLAAAGACAQEADVLSLPGDLSVRPASVLLASPATGLQGFRDGSASWLDKLRQHDWKNQASSYSASMRYAWQHAATSWSPVSLGPIRFGGMAHTLQKAYSPASNATPYLLMPVAATNFRLWGTEVGANFAYLPNLNRSVTSDPNRLVVQFRMPLD